MTRNLALEWPGRRRGLARLALLFAVTLGTFWPIWLVQIVPSSRDGARARRGRIAVAVAAVVPGLNVVFEVALALLLPRGLRRFAESRPGASSTETEAQTFLLLAAPVAAIAIALAVDLPFWLVGYLAWPLELPAALVVQRALNRLEAPGRAPARGRDAELLACGVLAGALAIGAVLALLLNGGDDKGKPAPARARQTEQASDIVATPRGLWITRIEDNELVQLDSSTLDPTGTRVRVGRSPYDVAFGFGDLWVADYRNDSVSRVDPRSHAKPALIPTGRGPFGVAVGYGRVWVANEVDRNLVEIDPRTNRVRRKITVGLGPRGVDTGEGAVWVAGSLSSSVVRVDPDTGARKRIPVPALCQDVAVGGGSVWAAIPQANSVVRIDPALGRRAHNLISVGLGPTSLDYGRGSVWVANGEDGTVSRIDARTGRVVGSPRLVGGKLVDITVSGRNVYVLRADGVVRRITAS
jgi:YVTN family beta-propeller protein